MFKHAKKDAQRVQPLNVETNYFENILCQYHKPKRGFLQWVLILTHGNSKKMNA